MNIEDQKIWISRNGARFGPYSGNKVQQFLKEDRLAPTDLAFVGGDQGTNWTELGELLRRLDNVDTGGQDLQEEEEEEEEETSVDQQKYPEEIRQLDRLVADCKGFRQLLHQRSFNLWKTLDISTSETSHQLILEWLFDLKSSHKLGDTILRRWLIRILQDDQEIRDLNPVNVEYLNIVGMKIEREWLFNTTAGNFRKIDFVITLKTEKQGTWKIVIEIKICANLSDKQLEDYREGVNRIAPADDYKLYVILFDKENKPTIPKEEKPHWIEATFTQLRQVLFEIRDENTENLSAREKDFIDQYLEILPPLVPEGSSSENLEELSHKIYAEYWRGIEFARNPGNYDLSGKWIEHARLLYSKHATAFSFLPSRKHIVVRKRLRFLILEKYPSFDVRVFITTKSGDWTKGINLTFLAGKTETGKKPRYLARIDMFESSPTKFKIRLSSGCDVQDNIIFTDKLEALRNASGSQNHSQNLILNVDLEKQSDLNNHLFHRVDNILKKFTDTIGSTEFSDFLNDI
jgi:hypothetical protein